MMTEAFLAGAEPLQRQALVAELAVEALVGAVYGFPRSLRAVATSAWAIHSKMARLTNSGPLSERLNSGAPRPRWPPKLPHLWPLKLPHLAGVN